MSKKETAEKVEAVDPLTAAPEEGDLPASWDSKGSALAVPEESAPLEKSDLITPKLHLSQRIGPLAEQFGPGVWILNKELKLTEEVGESLQIIVLEKPFKFYMEHLPYDPQGEPPRYFRTLDEVQEAGLTVEWDNVNNIRASADRAARVLLLISKPENLDDEQGFGMQIDGVGSCAVASWLLTNTAYRSAARRLFTAEQMDLNGKPFYTASWKLCAIATKSGGYSIFAPQLTPGKRVSDEAVEAIKARLNPCG